MIEAHSESTAIIGDRMDTDVVAAASRQGCGRSSCSRNQRRAVGRAFPDRPSLIVESVSDLVDAVGSTTISCAPRATFAAAPQIRPAQRACQAEGCRRRAGSLPRARTGGLPSGGEIRFPGLPLPVARADQPCAAAARHVRDAPAQEDDEPVLESDQVGEVDRQPDEPRREPGEPQSLDVGDGARAADRGEISLVAVVERPVSRPSRRREMSLAA